MKNTVLGSNFLTQRNMQTKKRLNKLTFHRINIIKRRIKIPARVANKITHHGTGGASANDFADLMGVMTFLV